MTLMVQADMTAYHAPGEPMQLGLPQRSVHTCSHRSPLLTQPAAFSIGTQEVADLVTKVAEFYSPELHVGYTAVRVVSVYLAVQALMYVCRIRR